MSVKTKVKTPSQRSSAGAHRDGSNRARNQPAVPKAVVPREAGHIGARQALILCFLLAVAAMVLYSPVGKHPFIQYDDQSYVFENAHVIAGLTWDTLTWAVTATEQSNWHPLTWLSHALDCQLFGLNPSGHHWMNAAIHALNVVLLFLLLWRATGSAWKSFLVAALFGVHPLNVESVAWVAERKNVLSTLFLLLALGSYGWYVRKPEVRRYLVLVLLFVLGLASKPMVITLPFVLLLLDYWPLQRIENWSEASAVFPVAQARLSRVVLEKLPLLALSAGSAIITVAAQSESVVPTQVLPIGVRLETSLYAYGMYFWKAIWPAHLALIYPHPGRTLPAWQPLLSGTLIVLVLIVAWKQRFSRPYLAVGWLWYLGTAVPVIGIVQVGVQVIADRYAYLPLIGVFVAAVWEGAAVADQFRFGLAPRAVTAALILAALGFTTWRQIGYWRSTVDLWTHALQVTTDNTMAENFLANNLFQLGRYEEGMAHLRNYARLEPLDPIAHARVAADFQDHGQLPEAIKEYDAAIRAEAVLDSYGLPGMRRDTLAVTYANLGLVYFLLGNEAQARDNSRKALDIDQAAVVQLVNELGQYLNGHPAAQGYLRLGLLLEQIDHRPEAQQAFAQARRLDPRLVLPPMTEEFRH
jgi:hypothetical protein